MDLVFISIQGFALTVVWESKSPTLFCNTLHFVSPEDFFQMSVMLHVYSFVVNLFRHTKTATYE